MRNEVIFDKSGIPDIMVAFTPDELGLPAELKGRKVEAYLIGKYPATMIDGVPHSLPFQKPAVDINHDEAIRLCEAKGPGWHLITNDEWAALAHQSRKNGTLPRGNTNSGKSHSHPEETGTTYEGGYGKTLTGSGPVTWNHDHTAEGVADMCGNVWEHVGGIRFVDGKVQVIPRNEAAAGADQSKDSPEWVNIYTADGDPIYYEVTDDEIWLRATEPEEKDYCGVSFTDLEPGEVDNLDELIRLGLYPADGYEGSDYFWLDTNGGRCVSRGGNWIPRRERGRVLPLRLPCPLVLQREHRLPARFCPVLWRLWLSGQSGRGHRPERRTGGTQRADQGQRQKAERLRRLPSPAPGDAAGDPAPRTGPPADGALQGGGRKRPRSLHAQGIRGHGRRTPAGRSAEHDAGAGERGRRYIPADQPAASDRDHHHDHDQEGGGRP